MSSANKIKTYLKTMASQVRDPKKRKEVYREIRNHLHLKIEYFQSRGMSECEAIRRVLGEATAPEKLGRLMNKTSRSWFKRHPFLTAFVTGPTVTFLMVAIVSHLLISRYFIPEYNSRFEIAPHIANQFEADLKYISENPLFPPSRERFNASAFFVHKFALSSETISPKEIVKQQNKIRRSFSHSNWNEILTSGTGDQDLMAMDLRWLEQMLDYDHWNINVYSDSHKEQKSRSMRPSLPLSDFIFVEWAALAYAIQKTHQGDTEKALKLLRHISYLLHTTQSYMGQSASLRLLRAEHTFANHYDLNDYQLISLDKLDTYQRVVLGWAGIFQKYYFKGEISERWQAYLKKEVGVCPALRELSFNISYMSDYFSDQVPLEPSFYQITEKANEQKEILLSHCDLRGLLAIENTQEHHNSWNQDYSPWEIYIKTPHLRPEPYRTLTSWLPEVSKMPFLRRIAGLHLVSTNGNNAFEAYQSTSVDGF